MFQQLRPVSWCLILIAIASLNACVSTKRPLNRQEEFGSTDMFSRSIPGTGKAGCDAARRALLSQGYVINEWTATSVKGRRKFQSDDETHIEIEFNVVCAPNSVGSNSTTVFANAIRDRYSLKKSSSNASLGVGALGSVTLPFGASDDSLVKVASETISNERLYDRFFGLIERYLDDAAVNETDTVSGNELSDPKLSK